MRNSYGRGTLPTLIEVIFDVKNTGKQTSDEVVQIYVSTPDSPASAQRPINRLKGFQRVTIPVGQTKTVSVDIDCNDLWFWDMDADKISYDAGRYVFEIGSSSKDIRGTVTATMTSTELKPEVKVVVADCGVSVLKVGQTAQTKLTASLMDDTFLDLSKAKITYSSNNSSVLSVDAEGVVSAKSQGVATVTATVEYNGKSVSGSYSLKVYTQIRP